MAELEVLPIEGDDPPPGGFDGYWWKCDSCGSEYCIYGLNPGGQLFTACYCGGTMVNNGDRCETVRIGED